MTNTARKNVAADLQVAPIDGLTFSAQASLRNDSITICLTGNGDVKAQEPLEAFLTALHAEASRVGAERVELDCRELLFMNSSCLKVLVSWIGAVQDAPVEQHYKISFLSNPQLHWQKRSLRALSCFAPDLVTINQ
jgi:hypothetical protein